MAYQGRTLPPGEWPRLEGTALDPAWRQLAPDSTRVLVVEDAAGAIVACWSILTVAHAEGLWIRPDHRQRTAVPRALWATLRAAAAELGLAGVVTSADDALVARLLARHGTPLPGTHYTLRVAKAAA